MLKPLTLVIGITLLMSSIMAAAQDCVDTSSIEQLNSPDQQPVPVSNIPPELWFISGRDWIIAPDSCAAAIVARELVAARAAFASHFQTATTFGAVIDLGFAAHAEQLTAAGADWVLPWQFSQSTKQGGADDDPLRALIEEQIRSQVESQLAQGGQVPEQEQVDALVAQALDQWESQSSNEPAETDSAAKRPDAIRHEVAHMLFIHELWPSTQGAEQYGGDAPDWLDEAAAVLAESEEMTASRRAAFVEAVQNNSLIPLAEYLNMPHPAFGGGEFQEIIEQAREQARGTGVTFITAKLPEGHIDDAALFYTQTRGLIDFLTESSQDPLIFLNITRALKNGMTFEQWLSNDGQLLNLPAKLELLDAAFNRWAEKK